MNSLENSSKNQTKTEVLETTKPEVVKAIFGKLKLRLKDRMVDGETSRVYCLRASWNSKSLRKVASKLGVGDGVRVEWSTKGSTTTKVWVGIVKAKTPKLTKVDYGDDGVHVFPPNHKLYTTRSVVVSSLASTAEKKIAFRCNRCTVGDTLVHRFRGDDGVLRTWRGIVIGKFNSQLRVKYPDCEYPLRFPMPRSAKSLTEAFWFVARSGSSSKDRASGQDTLQADLDHYHHYHYHAEVRKHSIYFCGVPKPETGSSECFSAAPDVLDRH